MTGSNPFSIESSKKFESSLKKLAKKHKGKDFVDLIAKILEDLTENQSPKNSRQEPLPKKIKLSADWTFHKLEVRFSTGASGQIRLMYLVNPIICKIRLVWIYSHEEFEKRPPDGDITSVIEVWEDLVE